MYIENVGKMYDTWMNKQADEYWSGCEPEVVDAEQEYEGIDDQGNIKYSTTYVYNCSQCDNVDCDYWKKYND